MRTPKTPPHTTLTTGANTTTATITEGESLTFWVTVTSNDPSAPGSPTGVVTLQHEHESDLGSAPVEAGGATFSISALGVGTYQMRAVYAGSEDFEGSTSDPVYVTVDPVPRPRLAEDLKQTVGGEVFDDAFVEFLNVRSIYFSISDHVGLLAQMLGYCQYSQGASFKAFLCSPHGYNEEIDDETSEEDWFSYAIEMVHHVIVMLHAVTEDVVRTLARLRLPRAEAKVLQEIPIARPEDIKKGGLKELGQLVPHRGKTVNDLIQRSVDSWLDHQTFNSSQQVVAMLQRLGIPLEQVRPRLSSIDRIAQLRHQIAHSGESRQEDLEALLDGGGMYHYIRDVYLFARDVLLEATPSKHRGDFQKHILEQERPRRSRTARDSRGRGKPLARDSRGKGFPNTTPRVHCPA
jgi:hypothetical protein